MFAYFLPILYTYIYLEYGKTFVDQRVLRHYEDWTYIWKYMHIYVHICVKWQ